MPYFTRVPGLRLDMEASPVVFEQAQGLLRFDPNLFQAVGLTPHPFADYEPAEEGATELAAGDGVTLVDAQGAPMMWGEMAFLGTGTLASNTRTVAERPQNGYDLKVSVHPVEGVFLRHGIDVYFVTEEPMTEANLRFDLVGRTGDGTPFDLRGVSLAELAGTPPMDGPPMSEDIGRWAPSILARSYPLSELDPHAVLRLGAADPICFAAGTMIETATGPRPVERLAAGDLVHTADNGLQALRWVGRVALSVARLREQPALRPVRIGAGALGPGQPRETLLLSPQHRVLVRSQVAQRMFGVPEVLVAARQLVGLPGIEVAIEVAAAGEGVVYFHLLFDRHELVHSNGAVTESLYLGPQALKSLDAAARREILILFPVLRGQDGGPRPVRVLVPGRKGRKLAERHLRNRKALLV